MQKTIFVVPDTRGLEVAFDVCSICDYQYNIDVSNVSMPVKQAVLRISADCGGDSIKLCQQHLNQCLEYVVTFHNRGVKK